MYNSLVPILTPYHRNQFPGGQNFPDYPISVPATGAYTLTADYGAYTLTGQDAALVKGWLITADYGLYNLTGQDAALTYTPVGAFSLTADYGLYNLTGQVADLLRGHNLSADYGVYNLSGQDAGLIYTPAGTYTLTADYGLYNLNGQIADLLRGHSLQAEYGLYALTGQDANLTYAPPAAYTITALHGIYNLTGQLANLTYSGFVDTLRGGGYVPPTLEQIQALRRKKLTKKQKAKVLKRQLVEQVENLGELPKPEVVAKLVESLAKTSEETNLLPQIEKIMAMSASLTLAKNVEVEPEVPTISPEQAFVVDRIIKFFEFVDEDVFTLLKII